MASANCCCTHDILLRLRFNLGTAASEFERFQRLGAIRFLGRQRADNTNVRVSA